MTMLYTHATAVVLYVVVFNQAVKSTEICQFCIGESKAPTTVNYEVDIKTKEVNHVVDERFLSFAIGVNVLRHRWERFNLSSPKLHALTRALAPAYLRLSGTTADFLVFRNPCSDEEITTGVYDTYPQTYLCPKDWNEINTFCEETGLKLIFGLNLLLRTKQGGWDPSNAEKLLDYNIYDVAWELGNEPNSFPLKANISISGTQIGSDFNLLRSILQSRAAYAGASVYGPDIGAVGSKKTTEMLGSFLAKTNVTNATTFHSYYLNGRTATVDDFLDPKTLDGLPVKIDLVNSLVIKFHGGGSVWLGETGSAYGGGAPNISDRFVAGFLFLNKLGIGAQKGLDVIIRQSYYGAHYTMLDLKNLDPKPDYWTAYIYKHLVSRKVLQVQVKPLQKGNDNLREPDKAFVQVYGHCTATNHSGYHAGAVTLIVLNMHKTVSANITLTLEKQIIHQYLLTPYGSEGMTSSRMELNGRLLQLINDTVLPQIEPVVIKPENPVVLPPLSYGFYVLPKANAKACLHKWYQ